MKATRLISTRAESLFEVFISSFFMQFNWETDSRQIRHVETSITGERHKRPPNDWLHCFRLIT
jgi:hypothetical protein